MSEIGTEENGHRVSDAYGKALETLSREQPLPDALRMVHDVEHLMQEANSGVSFEQYFRWASLDEMRGIVGRLEALGLDEVASIVARAMAAAFPRGLPLSEEDRDDDPGWSQEVLDELMALFDELEAYNGRVTNVLGAYVASSGA